MVADPGIPFRCMHPLKVPTAVYKIDRGVRHAHLAESLGVTQAAISKRLKAAGYIQKQGNWVPRELKPRDVERRFCMSEMLPERHKKKSFLHRIVTGDEKWIHYGNPKRKK